MKEGFFFKGGFFPYIVFGFIILFCIFTFYLSCKSKSPTEATPVLDNQVSTQSTNNTTQTTSSSSTTTTVKPGQSPNSTTTLITSRTLTTTSIRITTTTTSSTITTTIPPTTTISPTSSTSTIMPTSSTSTISSTTTTSIIPCDIRWPELPPGSGGYIMINSNQYSHGDSYHADQNEQITVQATMCNYGSAEWDWEANLGLFYFSSSTGAAVHRQILSCAPFPPGGSSSCKTITFAPFQASVNGYFHVYFKGCNDFDCYVECNSIITIIMQINE